MNAEFAKMSREERLRLRFQAMVRDLDDEEDLDDLDALQLIHIFGKDHKERTVVFLSGANLMVRTVPCASVKFCFGPHPV